MKLTKSEEAMFDPAEQKGLKERWQIMLDAHPNPGDKINLVLRMALGRKLHEFVAKGN